MNGFTKAASLAYLGLTLAAVPRPAIADPISARLDALEKENAALRARINRLETSRTATPQRRIAETGAGSAARRPAPLATRRQHGRRSQLQRPLRER